jgi:hypothetical protein
MPNGNRIDYLSLPLSLERDGWPDLLTQWVRLLDRYTELSAADGDPDVAFWYGERTLTGLLVAVAWQLDGGAALEEYACLRGETREQSAGRGDAWIRLPKKARWYNVEAKQRYISNEPITVVKSIQTAIDEAWKQLDGEHPDYHQDAGIALCYGIPDLPVTDPMGSHSIVIGLAEQLKKHAKKNQLVATYIPKCDERHVQYQSTSGLRCHPGVILVGEAHDW